MISNSIHGHAKPKCMVDAVCPYRVPLRTPTSLNHRCRSVAIHACAGCASYLGEGHPPRSWRYQCRPRVVTHASAAFSDQKEAPPQEPKVEVDGVDVIPLTKNVTLLRGTCSSRLKFEIEYGRKRGTTDNSYLVKDGTDSILIDVPDEAFVEHYVKALTGVINISKLTALVITHLTPNRVAALKEVLKRRASSSPSLEVYLSNPALQALRSNLGKDQEGQDLLSTIALKPAKAGNYLGVGKDDALRLIPTPTPRWPDLLCAYSPRSKLLFTSKLFAAHVAPSALGSPRDLAHDVGGWDALESDWRYYYDCMLAPVARQAAVALEKLDIIAMPSFRQTSVLDALKAGLRSAQAQLESSQASTFGAGSMGLNSLGGSMIVTALAPLHGPVVQSAATELLYKYREWTQAQIKSSQQCSVAVLYASAYGNTAALAQAISRGITKAGVGVETLNLESTSAEEVNEALERSAGFVIGSPTLGGHMPTQVATALGTIIRSVKAKQQLCGVFGSFGWSGEAVDELESRLKDAGFRFAFDKMRVKFKPTAKDMQQAEESGTDLAQALLKRLKKEEKQSTSNSARTGAASETEQAVGRLIGALCAVTARDEDAESAMLASWISQASFDPPGLTVAVKKDRAVESLLVTGNKFVVNILADGNHKPLMKQLLKPFKPGEDRFTGLDITESVGGGVVLPGAASYVDCTVADRMEAGDHYLVYATVDSGEVVDATAVSAVHHRKVGTTY